MTIEAKIDALIEALNKNTAALQGAMVTAVSKNAAKTPEALVAASAAAKKATEAAPAPAAPAQEAPAAPQTPAAEPNKALTYDDVKVPFLALVKKNRDLALATLKPFGLDSLKPAKPEQFAAILAALNNALESA